MKSSTTDHEQEIRLQTCYFKKFLCHRIAATVQRMVRRKVGTGLPAAENRRAKQFRQMYGFVLGVLIPNIIAEHQGRTATLTEFSSNRFGCLGARRSRTFNLIPCAFSNLCLKPFTVE